MNKKRKSFKIAIIGATGLVGSELIEALLRRDFPISELRLFSSWNTAGEDINFKDDEITVQALEAGFHQGLDFAIFAAHPMISRDMAEQVAADGVTVIDAGRSFRLDPDVPLLVPEVNPEKTEAVAKGIIASPSPAAIALSLVLHPLNAQFEIRRVVAVTTHGSTSEGRPGFEEHHQQVIDMLNAQDMKVEKFIRQAAFNIFPRVGPFIDDITEMESDIQNETAKILGLKDLKLSVTSMQAPIFCGVSIAANIEAKKVMSEKKVREVLQNADGITIMDNPQEDSFPDTISAMASDEILVGRIRKDQSHRNAVNLWISADNLRKGAALNIVQILEEIAHDMD